MSASDLGPSTLLVRKLRAICALGTLIVALPVTLIIISSYEQFKREKFDEYHRLAVDVNQSIASRIDELVTREQHRPFDHFQFLTFQTGSVFNSVTQAVSPFALDSSGSELPGLLGCFEREPDGKITTPLLPNNDNDALLFNQVVIGQRKAQAKDFLDGMPVSDFTVKAGPPVMTMRFVASNRGSLPTDSTSSAILEGEVSLLEVFRARGRFSLYRQVSALDRKWIQGCIIREAAFFDRAVGEIHRSSSLADRVAIELSADGSVIETYQGLPDHRMARLRKGDRAEIADFSLPAPFSRYTLTFFTDRIPLASGAKVLQAEILLSVVLIPSAFLMLYFVGTRAIAASETRARFASMVAHELRTPLTSIRMHVEMLQSGIAAEPEQQLDYYDRILSQIDRLTRLVNGALRVSGLERSETEAVHEERTEREATELIDETARQCAALFGVHLEREFDECADSEVGTVSFDSDSCRTIIENLIGNAAKFAGEGTTIVVGSRRLDGVFEFFVRDHGPGLSDRDIRYVGRAFERGSAASATGAQGMGLGLAIVSTIVRSLGGSVHAKNSDTGAQFTVRLPVKKIEATVSSR